jgi:hypothetical protein
MTNGNDTANAITNDTTRGQSGLNKREYFAAKAMIGLVSNHTISDSKSSIEWAAKTSVLLSDALISELNKTN